MTPRRSLLPALAGTIVGLFVALLLWVFLFGQYVVVAPLRYPTSEAAESVAVEAGGRYRWPGTAVRVRQVDPGRVEVERTWLGMRESTVQIEQTGGGWEVGLSRRGPAER